MPNPNRPLTASQREHHYYMADAIRRLEWDLHNTIDVGGRIPAEWHEIARARRPRRKVKVTLWLDEAVLRFLKSQGRGYGERANAVLEAFMHARLAGLVKGADTIDPYRDNGFDAPERPAWGLTDHEMTGGDGPAPRIGAKERIRIKRR
ncbi:BrnA antitoxin family protein [Pseudothioclava arenosa]|uniref:BrnA antitoxin of type II toxin-antitoxin system n=1 Tax=Pseudothioclava arenosa TaxID=1795308 RepID=A0A2A4CPS5_9RHOB|nr:BrnA antitoxin family protein [Pseudothioclava arenosa]PCD76116.1 hypothetical protein CLN94_09765 [Pseudothioclava arenosa]